MRLLLKNQIFVLLLCPVLSIGQSLTFEDLIGLQSNSFEKAKGFFNYKGWAWAGITKDCNNCIIQLGYDLSYDKTVWNNNGESIQYLQKSGFANAVSYYANKNSFISLENEVKSKLTLNGKGAEDNYTWSQYKGQSLTFTFNYYTGKNIYNIIIANYKDIDNRIAQLCATCKGKGQIIENEKCSYCSGDGKKNCYSCTGKGRLRCDQCNGDTYYQCQKCNGSGILWKCNFCNTICGEAMYATYCSKGFAPNVMGGINLIDAAHANKQKEISSHTCDNCNGSGKLSCVVCSGTGQIKCPKCKGSGNTDLVCTFCNGKGTTNYQTKRVCLVCNGSKFKQNSISQSQTMECEDTLLPKFQWETTTHDFGKIVQGERVRYSYKFKNVGSSDLIISTAKGSCGCLATEYKKEPVKPSESGAIYIVFDSEGKTGYQNKTITIMANTNPNTLVLNITGEVEVK